MKGDRFQKAIDMNYYNAVLIPPQDYARKITASVQANFSEFADGYCLGGTVFPHITLCQFQAEKPVEPDISTNSHYPEIKSFTMRIGDKDHEGYIWLQLFVTPTPELIRLSSAAREAIIQKGGVPRAEKSKPYAPHITLCRIKKSDLEKVNVTDMDSMLPSGLLTKDEKWTYECGHSDFNGQYLGRLLDEN